VDVTGNPTKLVMERDDLGYSVALDPMPSSETIWLNLVDSDDSTYSVPQQFEIVEMDTTLYVAPKIGLMRLYPGLEMDAREIAVLTSPLPIPYEGIPDSLRKASPLISIQGIPSNARIDMRMQVDIYGDSLVAGIPDAVTVFQWNDGWKALETSANVLDQTASVHIVESGTYAVFLDLTKATGVAVEDLDPIVPEPMEQFSNYPNPFRWTTTIPFQVERPAEITVRVYNVLGQVVMTLAEGQYPEGAHEVIFDARDLPPGLYLSEITIGEERRTGVMVHL
jgi:hypothetical protein